MSGARAYSTIDTVLTFGTTRQNQAQLTRIKSIPQLGGEPEQIETTDLEDRVQTFVPGVQSVDTSTFICNYTPEGYTALKASSNTPGVYRLFFAEHSAFEWEGQHDVFFNGGGVNEALEMTVTVTPSTEPVFLTPIPARPVGLIAGLSGTELPNQVLKGPAKAEK
jgi:hypothetical protein